MTINTNYFNRSAREEMLKYIPANAEKILEVGCGEGLFLDLLTRAGKESWGLEINAEAAVEAQKFAGKILVGDFIAMSLSGDLPLGYFDCVVFNDVIEHFTDPWQAVRLVKPLLSPAGVIVASIPNFRYIGNLVEIITTADFRYREEGGILDMTHFRFFTLKSIIRLFDECGYRVVRYEGLRPCKSWKEKMVISLSMGRFEDMRHKQFAVVAQPRESII